MLALDDAALARFIRAANKVSYRKRGRWLQAIAKELDPGSSFGRLRTDPLGGGLLCDLR